ncbi:MAG: nuclear transport factor 2 family protein [Acidimicrobiales bacterium]|jgi:hypothetical protein
MSNDIEQEAKRACEALVISYTHIADFGPGSNMPDLFTEDGVWTSGAETYEGRQALSDFFGRDRGHTKSRHVASNIAITVDGDEAEGLSYFTLYRYAEEKPRVPDLDQQPVILGEYRDQYRRTSDGWRISRRQAEVGFVRRSMM